MPKSRIKLQRDAVLPRIERTRDYSYVVIAVEGAKAEPQYFAKFGSERIRVKVLSTRKGSETKNSPADILERLSREALQEQDSMEEGDQYWLVFDVDDRDEEALRAICDKAKVEGFQVAISNPCFEFWLFLHKFEVEELPQHLKALPQEKRPKEMKQILRFDYRSLTYKEFREAVERATERAKANEQGNRKGFPNFPGSHLYRLVEKLPIKT